MPTAHDHPSHNGKVQSPDGPAEKKLTGAHGRAAALKAMNPVAYSHYARYTDRMLEADMDRPSAGKSKSWVSINTEEVRIKADIIRHSGMWPICMPHAVLTLGDYGLTYQQAARQGMRLGDDEGQYTFVLDKNGEPKPYTQAWICRNLGMKRQNVSGRVKHMALKKILIIGDKGLTVDPAPLPLTEAERKSVIRTDDKIPQHLKEVLNGFKPRRSHLEILSKLPEVICLDYFHRLHDIHLESEKKLDAIRAERDKAMDDILAEAAILIEQVSQDVQGEASSSLEREQAEEEETTTTIPDPEPEEEPQPEEPEIVGEALKPYCGEVDTAGIKELIFDARLEVPDLATEELCEVIHDRGKIAKTGRNPFGLLKTDLKKRITKEYIEKLRARENRRGCRKCGEDRTTVNGLCADCSAYDPAVAGGSP
jgi:hypothetical protein